MKANTDQNHELSAKNKFLFKSLLILFPFVLLIIIELLLRAFSVGENVHLVINHPNKYYHDYYVVNPMVGKKYFNRFDATKGVNDIFLKEKPENGFRLFVLGSSSLVGFPYDKNLMATRILHKRLQDAYPDKCIEVVNTAITAVNSITLNDYMNEIVHYKPDAILIYAGHNEFYGALGIGSNETMSQNETIRNIHFKLMNFRLYQLLRNGYTKLIDKVNHAPNVAESKGSLMKRIVADPEIEFKSHKYYQGIAQYRNNMSQILKKAADHKIPVFYSNLVCNVKDIPPLGATNEGIEAYNQAVEKLKSGDFNAARELFYQAKDLDPVRFRASEDINFIIDSLAKAYRCYFIETKAKFEEASPNGLIGDNLMTEHLHPNINGQFLLADAFFESIESSKLVGTETNPLTTYSQNYYRQTWGYTVLDSLIGEFRVKQLKSYWPFTSLDNPVSFRDTYKPHSVIDSLAFTVLLSSNADVESLHQFLATEYLGQNNFGGALKEYRALVNLNPYRPDYANQAGNCLLKMNDLYAAEKYFNLSLNYRKTYFASFMMAEIEMIKHNFKQAITLYEQALSLAENEDEKNNILKKLYLAYYYGQEPDKQKKIVKELESRKIAYEASTPKLNFSYSTYIPTNIVEKMKQVDIQIKNNQLDSAILYLHRCIKLNDAPVANKLMGDLLFKKKDKNLLYYYSKAYNAYSFDPVFLQSYCVANIVNLKFDEAKQTLSQIKKLYPDYPETATLERLLKDK